MAKTKVCFTVRLEKTDGTSEIMKYTKFYVYELDATGAEINSWFADTNGKWCIDKTPGTRYRVKDVLVLGYKIEKPSDGIYAAGVVSTSSPQNIEIAVKEIGKIISVLLNIYVKDKTSGNLIQGASVKVQHANASDIFDIKETDDNGKCLPKVTVTGKYLITITKNGYKKSENTIEISSEDIYAFEYLLERNYNLTISSSFSSI